MAILTIEQIINADDLPSKTVEVPEWGGDIEIRQLTKQQQDDVRTHATNADGEIDDVRLEIGFLIEASINPKLTYEHVGALRNKNAAVLDRLIGEVFALSHLGKEAIAEKRAAFQGEAGAMDGVSPSGEAGDDASPDA